VQGEPRCAGHAETDHGENLGGIAERPVLCGVGAGEIKKDQVCYSAAPSTTNQNATQGIYIKDIKWLGKSL
jgi:hypothetical protein